MNSSSPPMLVHYAIDLAAARPSASPLSNLLLALGVAAAVWTGLVMHRASQSHEALAQTLARLDAALDARGAATRVAAARLPSTAERRLQTDLAHVSADLYRPWFALLDALSASAVPQVHLQQLSVDGAFTKLQLQVDAPDLPALLRYVHALEGAGAPLQGTSLLSHEWQQPAAAGSRRLLARVSVALGAGHGSGFAQSGDAVHSACAACSPVRAMP